MSTIPSLFILSSERSGTNLLRVMLAAHTRIASPPPSGMVVALKPAMEAVKAKGGTAPRELILEYAVALTQTHLNPWKPEPKIEDLEPLLPDEPTFWQVFGALNANYLESQDADHWLTKEPGLIHHVAEILDAFPNAYIIFLVRDGRDVAISMTKKQLHAKTIRMAIARWRDEQRIMLDYLSKGNQKAQIHTLRYEDLITSPKESLQPILEAIGLEFEPGQLAFYKQDETKAHAEKSVFWKELAKPISASNYGKYRSALNEREIELCEAEAGDELRELGYEHHFDRPRPIRWHERLMEKLKSVESDIEGMSEEEREARHKLGELMREIRSETSGANPSS